MIILKATYKCENIVSHRQCLAEFELLLDVLSNSSKDLFNEETGFVDARMIINESSYLGGYLITIFKGVFL